MNRRSLRPHNYKFMSVPVVAALAIAAALPAEAGETCQPQWDTTIGQPGFGTQGFVTAMHEYNGKLIVGCIVMPGAPAPVSNHIGQWDGSAWESLGDGVDNIISTMITFEGKLIVAGDFTTAGTGAANHIAQWDGTTWSPIGDGFDNTPVGLAVYEGQLVAAGDFTMSGAKPIGKVARWDGKEWQSMAALDTNGSVAGCGAHDGMLVVSGGFNTIDGVKVGKIARWDGDSWVAMDTGLQGFMVDTIISYNGDLVASGMFHSANDVPMGSVARWDGTQWQAFGDGIHHSTGALDMGYVYAMCEYNGQLIVGGTFDNAGGNSVHNLARWDGTAWHPMHPSCEPAVQGGCGTDFIFDVPISVWALTTVGDRVYVGGAFQQVFGMPTGQVASWSCVAASCPADVDGDLAVNVNDLLAVIVSWGPCPVKGECSADLDGNSAVDVNDLLAVIVAWGPCK